MKKITFLLIFMVSFGFAQNNNELIQAYLNLNKDKLNLSQNDISDWYVESTGNSESTKIDNYYIKQRVQGIDVFNAVSNVWIKNNQVVNVVNGFTSNVSDKINTIHPNLTVLDALNKLFLNLGLVLNNNTIIETVSEKEFKISNGLLINEPIRAKLVFQTVGKNLKLAWDFDFYTQDHLHMWSVRVDAISGNILDKHDGVISCSFDTNRDRNSYCSNEKNKINFFELAYKNNLLNQIQGGSYTVIPFNFESPNHTSFQTITNPETANASPKGWHDTNTLSGNLAASKYTITRGNNAWAQADYGNTNPSAAASNSPNGGTSLVFNFPYGGTGVASNTYIDAANTNLFYMNNICHDIWFQYGFNEANGNFQKTNYTPVAAPASNDFVFADAQDGSTATPPTFNNANFSSGVDGTNGRMQMYLWTYRKVLQLLNINSPSDIAGFKNASDNSFNPGHVDVPVTPSFLQTDFALYEDGSNDVGQTDGADACSLATNAALLNGKIVVVRRSTSTANGGTPCSFAIKVKNAQMAGAIAVIVVNNDSTAPNQLIGMAGADASITIPAISVSLNVGEAIIAKIKVGIVNGKIQSPEATSAFVNTDGDFDNGVVAHEFGHGISTRLSGGRNNSSCLQNYDQMGEGWSDWFALMLQLKPTDTSTTAKSLATFVLNQPITGAGLRSYRYTTDMSVNPLTFTNSNTPVPTDPTDTGYRYVTGDFWATVLYDLSWAYIGKYGYDDNKYTGTGGNNKVMRLVLDGIKLQPCSPGIVNGRDALIAADQATTGGKDYCLITEVFRRRGVGLNASSGDTNDCSDQVEDFTPFPAGSNCTLATNYFQNEELFRIYPNPTNGLLNIRINNYVGKVNIQVVDINGRTVSEIKNEDFNTEKEINLNSLQSGIYIVKITGDDLNFTQKVIKN